MRNLAATCDESCFGQKLRGDDEHKMAIEVRSRRGTEVHGVERCRVQSSHRRRTGREEKSREVRAPWFMALNRSQLDFTGDGFVMADMTQLSSAVRTQFIQSLRCLSSKSGLPMPMPQPMPDAAAARLESAIHDEAALTERRRLESSVSDHPPQISARTSTRLRELEAQSRE